MKQMLHQNDAEFSAHVFDEQKEIIEILKSYYLFEKESSHYTLAKAILAKAGIESRNGLFQVLVKLGIFEEDENIDLHRYEINTDFSEAVLENATRLANSYQLSLNGNKRKNLTSLPIITIDGQGTLDYDDALSIEDFDDYLRLVFSDPKDRNNQKTAKRIQDNRVLAEYFFDQGKGTDIAGVRGTLWAAYNGVTELIDHRQFGFTPSRRLSSVWFGDGYLTKAKAFRIAKEKMQIWSN